MVRFFLFILFLASLAVQYQIWYGRASMGRISAMKAAIQAQREDNDALRRGNEALQAEFASLAGNQDAIEEYARRDLNMIKPSEVLFRIETAEEAARKSNAIAEMPNVDPPEIKAGAKPTFRPKRSDLYSTPKNQRAPRSRDRRD